MRKNSFLPLAFLFLSSPCLSSEVERLISRNSDDRAGALAEIPSLSLGEKQALAQALINEFQNRDPVVANWAGEALVTLKDVAVPLVSEYLRSAREPMHPALDVLAALPTEARSEIEWLLEGLSERDLRAGFTVLKKMRGWRSAIFAEKAARHLNHPERWAREAAAYTLGRMGTRAAGQSDKLVMALEDPEITVRNASASALSLVKPNDPEISKLIAEKVSQGRDGLSRDVGIGALKDRKDEEAVEELENLGHQETAVEKYDTRKPSDGKYRPGVPANRKYKTRRSGRSRFNTRKSFRQRGLERSREE